MSSAHRRAWGYWSQAKLQILERYLGAFLTASKTASERIYIDAFAGSGIGVARMTGEEFNGSARIAAEATAQGSEHRFTRLRYFERADRAAKLERDLRADYPGRDIRVHSGDCNEQIPRALADLHDVRWAPTFAFLDPDGLELAWTTIEALADHKRGSRREGSGKPEYKVEMWILFSSQGLIRTLALTEARLRPEDGERATRLFGIDGWRAIYERRAVGEMDAQQAKDEYVNLMRWRLTRHLGYQWAHALELKNMGGGTVYHMIFATDNPAGDRIMSHLHRQALQQIPQMQQEARDQRSGQLAFDLPHGELGSPPSYEYEPPWTPPGRTDEP